MKKFIFSIITLPILIAASCPVPAPTTCDACKSYTNPETVRICQQLYCGIPISTPTNRPTIEPTASPTKVPEATATATNTPLPLTPPVFFKINGAQVPDPATGKVGFTAFFRCPNCKYNQAWPCDRDHAAFDDDGKMLPNPVKDQAEMYKVCQGRAWDITCGSIGNSFVQSVYPGDAHFEAEKGRNCYSGRIVGHGQFLVCAPSTAKVCINPKDYNDDATYAPDGHCAHGEINLTDKPNCQGPFSF